MAKSYAPASAAAHSEGVFCTATPTLNDVIRWYSALLSVFGPSFLNGVQRSVNRKVQGSNPCPGANSPFCLAKGPGRPLPNWKSVAWGSSKVPELDQFESRFRWSQSALQQSLQQYHPESV